MIRSAWVVLNLVVISIPLCTLVIVYAFFGSRHRVLEWAPRVWCRWLLWASGVTVRLEGIEHVSLTKPQIITPNHVSWYDVLAFGACLPKRYRFIAKKELARVPLWGRAWQAVGHIAVDRQNREIAIESLDRAGRLVREDGSAIIIFPEGTRSPTGDLQPFRKGAFMLALHNGLDIVPAAVIGSKHVLSKNGWRVRPGTIILRFAPAVSTRGLDVGARDEIMDRVRTQIADMLGDSGAR